MIPITLTSTGSDYRGISAGVQQCEDDATSSTASLAALPSSSYCWKIERSDDEEEEEEEEDQSDETFSADETQKLRLGELFAEVLNTRQREGGLISVDNWATSCTSGEFKWQFQSSSSAGGGLKGSQFLGYCGQDAKSTAEKTIYVDVGQEQQSTSSILVSLDVCLKGKDCWTDTYSPGQRSIFSNKDSSGWSTVKFYVKS